MGDPGGGSDFAGFYNHLGIPILDWGFGGPGGVYHSAYDDYQWMTTLRRPRLRAATPPPPDRAPRSCCCASPTPTCSLRLRGVRPHHAALPPRRGQRGRGARLVAGTGGAPWRRAIARMEAAATDFSRQRDAVLARGDPPRAAPERANAALLGGGAGAHPPQRASGSGRGIGT